MSDDEPISVHAAAPLPTFFRTQLGPIILGIVALSIGLVGFFATEPKQASVGVTIGVVCALTVAACVVWAGVGYSLLVKRVAVYDDRLEWDGQVAGWGDLKSVWRQELIVNGSMEKRQLRIETRDGLKATFHYVLSGWEEMATAIQERSAEKLSPAAVKAYEAGKPVTFRIITLDKKGIKIGDDAFRWDEVSHLTVENGSLCVYRPGQQESSRSASLGRTENVLVLFRVLERTPRPPGELRPRRNRG